jgi:NAD-dependent deacetylase
MLQNIVILTGAGVSAESGLRTFRADDGLWEEHRIEDVCTTEAYARDPALVHQFYDARRARAAEVEPNPAHVALARLEAEWEGDFLLVTQNVDSLHERAGSKRLIHMHGQLDSGWCLACGERFPWNGPMGLGAACPKCSETGSVRPDIVWFGEMPYEMERIEAALMDADLFVSIGTSGAVYPAAGFGSVFFNEARIGPAGIEVPKWVDELLAQQTSSLRA